MSCIPPRQNPSDLCILRGTLARLEAELEACHHTIAVLHMEKAQQKLKAKTLALRLSHAEVLLKRAKEGGHV